MNYGQALRELREASKYTVNELAALSGVPNYLIEEAEQNHYELNSHEIKQVAEAIGLKGAMLFFLAIEKSDCQENKQVIYDTLYPAMKDLLLSLIEPKGSLPEQ
jgi:transcriptional regulator with XRE-family HTH domain